MKFAYSTNAYMRFPFDQAVSRIASLGYAGLELLADVPHAWPMNLLPGDVERIRGALDQHGMEISNVNAFMMRAVNDPRQPYWHPSWIEPDAQYRAIRREHTKRAIILAAEVGAPGIQTEPGGPRPPGMSRRHAYQIFYDELMPCVELAEKLNVHLLIEPEPGLLIERFEQFLEFVERIDSPAVGLNFDVGHAFCVEQAPEKWIPIMARYTRHYHIEDISAQRVHHHLIPGEGAIDFVAALKAILSSQYSGWITVELYPYLDDPDTAGRQALQFLQSTMQLVTN
ncbi:MAG: sugar phosphate isomerase/epimerase family protein [Thermogutta sp.]